jgi:hypothetical protein
MNFDAALDDVRAHEPASGYNLVGLDDFEWPGEQLYPLGHFETRAEAEAAQAEKFAEAPDVVTYIYGPPGDRVPEHAA